MSLHKVNFSMTLIRCNIEMPSIWLRVADVDRSLGLVDRRTSASLKLGRAHRDIAALSNYGAAAVHRSLTVYTINNRHPSLAFLRQSDCDEEQGGTLLTFHSDFL